MKPKTIRFLAVGLLVLAPGLVKLFADSDEAMVYYLIGSIVAGVFVGLGHYADYKEME